MAATRAGRDLVAVMKVLLETLEVVLERFRVRALAIGLEAIVTGCENLEAMGKQVGRAVAERGWSGESSWQLHSQYFHHSRIEEKRGWHTSIEPEEERDDSFLLLFSFGFFA